MKKLIPAFLIPIIAVMTSCGRDVQSFSENTSVPEVFSGTVTGTTVSQTVSGTTSTSSSASSTLSFSSSTVSTTVTNTVTTAPAKPEPPENLILSCPETIEVYEKINISSFIKDSNVEVKNGSDEVDTSELGEKELTVKYGYNGDDFEQKLKYTVVDTTPPVLLNSGWEPYVKTGTAFDLNTIVGFADNYDRTPTLTYTGDVDSNTVGIYPVRATVTDSSGNETSWDVDIVVLNEIPVPEDNSERMSFDTFKERYGGEGKRLGIDVSRWQGDIDFNAVKEAGCEFVIMRIGYYYSEVIMDEYYWSNIQKATDAGLDVSVYFYTADNSEQGIKDHAKWIADNLDGRQLNFPVAFDWEEWSTFQEYGMSVHDLNELFELFCTEMESYGYKGMLYSSKNFLNNFWENSGNHPVWLAHFVDETDYTGEYSIWQASSVGRINGIDGDVDLDILYTDKPL